MQKFYILWIMLICSLQIWSKKTVQFVGIFPIHAKGNKNNECGSIQFERGIQRLEAMEFAINQVNADQTVLKNLQITPVYIDSCDQSNIAVENVLQKILYSDDSTNSCDFDNGIYKETNSTLAGVIGASSSSVSMQVANLLRLFKIPQISYASTSTMLNDQRKYNFFTRTVPPDTLQIEAMIDLLKEFGWKSFSFLYSEGSYGEDGFEALKGKVLKEQSFCLVYHKKVNSHSNFLEIIEELRKDKTSKIVILFCETTHIRLFLNKVQSNDKFTIIASDFWGNKKNFLDTDGLKNVAEGAISLKLTSPYVLEFTKYFNNLNSSINTHNPWFQEYLDERANLQAIETQAEIPLMFDDKVAYVIDAVYALANAVNSVYLRKCPQQSGICSDMETQSLLRVDIMDTLWNLSYSGVFGQSKLNENGSSNSGYEVLRYVNGDYLNIGEWNSSILLTKQISELQEVSSFCSLECSDGEIRQQKANRPQCCFNCKKCTEDKYAINGEKCVLCEKDHERPNQTRTGCETIPMRYLPKSLVAVVVTLSGIGIVFTVFVILVFVYYKDTEIVRMSAPELTFPLLGGIFLCYCLPFILVADQNVALCGVRRFGIGFSFCLCYSSILTKTNRLVRVFNGAMIKQAPRFLSATSQVVIMSGIVIVEAAFATVGLMYVPPKLLSRNLDGKAILMVCQVPEFEVIFVFIYNLLIVLVCTIYAFRTRKIPACFNEAKHLGFLMYITILLLISFVPLYALDIGDDIYVVALSLNVVLCATSILVVLFAPKLYIIFIHPSRNKRSISMRSFAIHSHSMDND